MSVSSEGRLLTMRQVCAETSLHRATIYRMIAVGTFPKPSHHPSPGRVAWSEAVVETWKNQALNPGNRTTEGANQGVKTPLLVQ